VSQVFNWMTTLRIYLSKFFGIIAHQANNHCENSKKRKTMDVLTDEQLDNFT